MKKNYILILLVTASFFISQAQAQVFKLHAEYMNDWYGPGYTMTEDIAGYPSVTLKADSAKDQFVIEADNGFNRWKKYGNTGFDSIFPTVWYTINVGDNYLNVPTSPNQYYTTRIKNLGYTSTNFIVMETKGIPTNFAVSNPISQVPVSSNVQPNQAVDVTVSIASLPSPEEKFFVRYTTDNFATSHIVQAIFSGLMGLATIPGQPNNTQVKYYAFSSTFDATTPCFDYDLIALKQSTNGGLNYSYTTPPFTAQVTFQVDMSNEVVSPNGVHIAGSFNNFDPDSTVLLDQGNGIYLVKILLDTNATVQYKFINGNIFSAEELVPLSCGVPNGFGGYNRSYEVPGISTTIPLVCFSRCASCIPIVNKKITFQIQFDLTY